MSGKQNLLRNATLALTGVAALVLTAACNPIDLGGGTQNFTSPLYIQQGEGKVCAAIGTADQTTDLHLPDGYTVDAAGIYGPDGNLLVATGDKVFVVATANKTFSDCGRSTRYDVTTVRAA